MAKKKVNSFLKLEIFLLVVVGILLIINQVSLGNISETVDNAFPKVTPKSSAPTDLVDGAVEVQFYVMSQCPFGTQVEDAIAPVLENLKGYVDFKLDFIGNGADGQFSSLHGQPEVDGNKVQICAAKHEPANYMDMIGCMNKNARAIPGNWEGCAEDLGLDVEAIRTCYEGDEGNALLTASFIKAQQAGARSSPTIFVNGKPYRSQRTPAAFQSAICAEFADAPEACADEVSAVSPELQGNC